MILSMLLACASDPLPEKRILERAGYTVSPVPPDDEERVGLPMADRLEQLACFRVERADVTPARLCAYDFADWRGAGFFRGGPVQRPEMRMWGKIHGDRLLVLRSPDGTGAALWHVVDAAGWEI